MAGKPEDVGPRESNLVNRITDLIEQLDEKLRERAAEPKLLYTREEAASLLSISVGSIDVLIKRGLLHTSMFGRRCLLPREELERLAKRDLTEIWPERDSKDPGKQIA